MEDEWRTVGSLKGIFGPVFLASSNHRGLKKKKEKKKCAKEERKILYFDHIFFLFFLVNYGAKIWKRLHLFRLIFNLEKILTIKFQFSYFILIAIRSRKFFP